MKELKLESGDVVTFPERTTAGLEITFDGKVWQSGGELMLRDHACRILGESVVEAFERSSIPGERRFTPITS